MNTIINPPLETWASLCKRPVFEMTGLETTVREILSKVKADGDKALYEFSEKYDGALLKDLRVSLPEIAAAGEVVPENLRNSIAVAKANIEKFHSAQIIDEPVIETSSGVRCWRKSVPVGSAGLYIPGGTAPLFSTVLMLAVPARIAGCKNIVLCTPPDRHGNINPLVLYTAMIAGVTNIFRAGGAQAIAAMAYGTQTIPAVDKIFGPGNQYVTKAKELVQLDGIAIDMPAGPSEVLVIADESADPSFVAADLLSQAEHGPDSQVVMVTDNPEMIQRVKKQIDEQINQLPRKEIALKSLENSLMVQLKSPEECMDFSNLYAPEHLIISVSDPAALAGMVQNAGSVFLGKYSCESAGDYATGTNHTLPTNGFARSYSGISTDSFMKKISYQEVTPAGLNIIGPPVELMAAAEQLNGHKNAITIRLKSLKNV
jgi:histidinol dehydrogenase